MLYRVGDHLSDAGAIGYQTSSLYYTFSHWKGEVGFKLHNYNRRLGYKPIGPTILVEWEE